MEVFKFKKILIFFITISIFFSIFSVSISDPTVDTPILRNINDYFSLNSCFSSWSNITVISDDDTRWNNGSSAIPAIAVDNDGNIHVVWYDQTDGEWGNDTEIMYANYTATGWSNATVISDIYGWNDDYSRSPSVAIDNVGNIHVVWHDNTDGEWGTDMEIMYANCTVAGWSNATVISDDITRWNNGSSQNPCVAVDNNGNIHVVWQDWTNGEWGTDTEILYVNYTASGWSNATCISDSYGWNNGSSYNPSIAIDNNSIVHVVWDDNTDGEWGTDWEIMYTNYTITGWSNATVISDIYGWNNGNNEYPSITIDNNGILHVVWKDLTDGEWGTDEEIMYSNYTITGWSNATCISDIYGWNNGFSNTPIITSDNNSVVHVVWADETDGEWGTDQEIMYVNYTASGWSNATVISDDSNGWNIDSSYWPSIVTYGNVIHVVWNDDTDGEWGTDTEIMYANIGIPTSNRPLDIITNIVGPETINWTLWDSTGSGKYRVWANDTNNNYYIWQDWLDWIINSNLQVPINRTDIGIFNYTIEFNNSNGIFGIPDTVIVNITPPVPTSNQPENINTTTSSSDTIGWILWDPIGTSKYRIWANNTNNNYYIWQDWADWTNNTNLQVPINRTAIGIFNYTIEYNNSYGIYGTPDLVIVNVSPTIPSSNQPLNINTTTSGSSSIGWILQDSTGSGKYRVWVNDTNNNYYIWIDWTDWTNNTNLQVQINRTATGVFNYTIEYNNSFGIFGVPSSVIVNITKGSVSSPAYGPLLFFLLPEESNMTLIGIVIVIIAALSFIGLILIRQWQEPTWLKKE